MKILHYALGFPPYRSGGLTKYCIDLMIAQQKKGHEVAMIWPGKFSLSGHFVRFKKSEKTIENGEFDGKLVSFEIVNPMPVSLDEGILDIKRYTKKCPNTDVFESFLDEHKPDVIHIHTWMGLYKEFLEKAKEKGVRIIFTSHDYFGICPKVTLFRDGNVCDGDCSKCAECNKGALSLKKIRILQSGIYRGLKDSYLMKKIRMRHRRNFFEENDSIGSKHEADKTVTIKNEEDNKENYLELRNYYFQMWELVDEIHYNSSVTESVYRKFLPSDIKGRVINISHGNIADHRKKKEFFGKLKIAYLAAAKPFKGYLLMKEALDELWEEGCRDFELHVYQDISETEEYITVYESFQYNQLEHIFDESDLLVAPSVWYETFGFTVLEALSLGVPVLVTENVGAKDLLEGGYYGMVVKPTKDDVKQAVKYVIEHRELLTEYNRRIVLEMDLEKIINFEEKVEKMYVE